MASHASNDFSALGWFPIPMVSHAHSFPPKHDFCGEVNFLPKGKGCSRYRRPCGAAMGELPHPHHWGGMGPFWGLFLCSPSLPQGGDNAAPNRGDTWRWRYRYRVAMLGSCRANLATGPCQPRREAGTQSLAVQRHPHIRALELSRSN